MDSASKLFAAGVSPIEFCYELAAHYPPDRIDEAIKYSKRPGWKNPGAIIRAALTQRYRLPTTSHSTPTPSNSTPIRVVAQPASREEIERRKQEREQQEIIRREFARAAIQRVRQGVAS